MTTLEEQLGGAQNVIGGPFGSKLTQKDYVDKGVPVIRGSNMVSTGRWLCGDFAFVSEAKVEADLRSNLAHPGDIIVTQRGTLGQVAIVPEHGGFDKYVISQSQMAVRVPYQKADRDFVFYFLQSPQFSDYVETSTIQTGVPHINLGILRSAPTIWPKREQQKQIASVLAVVDDKIELNRRMNETLEAMARAIFRDWFVDFGPTRAKAEGRAPYLALDLWGQFPDTLDDEDKPVGWRQGTLADVADSPRRGVSPADVAEDTPYIGLEHMPRRSIALSEWEGAGKVTSNKSLFKKGEFLFGKLRPYFHKIGFAPLDGICSTDIVVVVPRAPEWGAFTLACLSSDEFVDYTDQTSTGTKMPRTSWKTMEQYKICLPSEQVARAYQGITQPLLDRIGANIHEARTLAQTRERILPKLMSGEIRLREAEKAVGAVA